ncbi:hypothetical protein JTB14_001375 [Gonioctena quinquepunctata]|nr:hypothetical protein JTB14_001375 [Gonioctena quinquepunctata]
MVPTLLSKKKVEFTGNVTDFPQLITNQNSTITVEERYAYARQQSPNRPSYSQTLNNKKRKPTTPITPPIHHSEEYRQCLFPPPCRTPVRSVINSPSQQMETEESQADSIDVVDFLKIIIEKTNLTREIKRQIIMEAHNFTENYMLVNNTPPSPINKGNTLNENTNTIGNDSPDEY